jgi:hypothetical protein
MNFIFLKISFFIILILLKLFSRQQTKLEDEDSYEHFVRNLLNFPILDDYSSGSSYPVVNNFSISSEDYQKMLSQVGISIPRVDRRIFLDAFFEIVNIQKILHEEILFIIQVLSEESTPTTVVVNVTNKTLSIKEFWKKFIEKLQFSIQNHLNTIREIAESTHYGRHLLLVEVEMIEFDLKLLIYQIRFPPSNIDTGVLQEEIIKKCKDIKKRVINIIESQRFKNTEGEFKNDIYTRFKNTEEEFKNNIYTRLVNLLENCNEVESINEDLSNTLNIKEMLIIHQTIKTEFKSSGTYHYCKKKVYHLMIILLLILS